MDQPNQTPFPQSPSPSSGNIGPLAAAVVIVLLLAVGGFYFFSTQEGPSAQIEDQGAQSGASAQNDSTDSIEADLEATQTGGGEGDVDNLDSAL